MNWFYSRQIQDNLVTIEGPEAQHASKVLRLKTESKIAVIDGEGTYYECSILSIEKQKIIAQIITKKEDYKQRDFSIHVAIAPTKNISRFEWFLEKATELGIDEISPVITKNSERKHIRQDRLEKILIAATKQSQKAKVPILNPIQALDDFFKSVGHQEKYMAFCNNDNPHLVRQIETGRDVLILIGPEGDFNENEIEFALKDGYIPIGLGKERLRTETAGLIAVSTIHLFHENLG